MSVVDGILRWSLKIPRPSCTHTFFPVIQTLMQILVWSVADIIKIPNKLTLSRWVWPNLLSLIEQWSQRFEVCRNWTHKIFCCWLWRCRRPYDKECRKPLELRVTPTWQQARKRGPQSYTLRNWILPTASLSLAADSAEPQVRTIALVNPWISPGQTLSGELRLPCPGFWPTETLT